MHMPVFRAEKVSDYAVIAKHHLKNRALSYKAKGLMTFMLCVPDDWDYSMAGLAVLASDGIDGVRSGIKELEKHGYLTRRRIRDSGGKLGDIEYTIHEIPQPPRNIESNNLPVGASPNHDTPTSEKPILENPTLDKPTQVLPTQENPMQYSNNALNIKESNNKELSNKQIKPARPPVAHTSPDDSGQLSLDDSEYPNQQAERLTVETAQGTESPVNHAMTLVEQQFELFWQLYPRKAGKKTAKRTWIRIKPNEALFLTIMSAINVANQYWQHQRISLKHIPHPSTWLDEERWEDEFSESPTSSYENVAHNGNDKGGVHNAIIGANYTIGGDDDPYRAIMPE
jgi:hypothetical protein